MAKNVYGFEKKNPVKAITIIEIIIIAIFAAAIIAMISFFFLFSKEGSHPKIFGYNIYLSRATNMAPAIPKDTAVFASPDEVDNLIIGNVVLCSLEYNDGDKLTTILRIQDIQLEDSEKYYILKGDTNTENEVVRVSQESIIAKGVSTSEIFGKLLSFATSQLGIITVIIFPSILALIIQVIHIIRYKQNYDEDEDDDEYNSDDVVFSTLKTKHNEFEEPRAPDPDPPVRQLYVSDGGKAEYSKKAAPTAGYNELHDTIRSTHPRSPMRTPTPASANLNAQRSTVSSNFKQKPGSRNAESALEIYFDKPEKKSYDQPNDNTYKRPRQYYDRASIPVNRNLASPAVENPVDITIPADAVMPNVTIAPPPKRQNNKTVEELMKVIDQAQSGLKK